ncbi:MAG: thioredoxin domain-containing protein [Planctomycetaceae bacterium]
MTRRALLGLLLAAACAAEEEMQPVRRNRLAQEKSPYLLQHAENPVDWYPWGEEAFAKAKREDKPVFLSIGYSSCHWCHVMEHESFADAKVARVLNAHFVAIKVDREERPDVDEIYMNAVVYGMGIGGGWPLSVWLTPDKKPFFGGTYFPKEDWQGRPGFLRVLAAIDEWWKDPERRKKIEAQGEQFAGIVQQVYDVEDPAELGPAALQSARDSLAMQFDAEQGGFGTAPKFPSPSSVETLLRWALRHDDKEAMEMVTKTLDGMAAGGIHDQVGGGFHRYSVTRDWLVPHFEKMLYDNAQLLGLYAWGWLATREPLYERTARDIAAWVLREMTAAQGGFFSAQDADDPGGPEGEGGFYVWDPAQLVALLGERDAAVVATYFDVSDAGNWPERARKSILQVRKSVDQVAALHGTEAATVDRIVSRAREAMRVEREKRPKPMTDTKVLAGWNGLMISGLCRAYQALGEEAWLAAARRAGSFLSREMIRDGRLFLRWREGEAAHKAVLSDYACVIAAFLDLYETTFEISWLEEALRLNRAAIEFFYDPEQGGFFFTASDHEKLLARGKPGFDQAVPSGNGTMALNLLRVFEMTGDKAMAARAQKTLDYFGNRVSQSALGFGAVLNALDFAQPGTREIFIAGPLDDPATRALIEAVWRNPDPNRVLALVVPGLEKLLPPAAGKVPVGGTPAAYVCRNFACEAPVTRLER